MLFRVPALLLGLVFAGAPGNDVLTVSASISLSDALEEVAAAYVKSGGASIRFNFAAANVLARQIVNGAPVDLFVSADRAQMDVVERAGALVPGTRRAIVSNRLAVIALPDRVAEIREAFPRAGPQIRRLAIGDPAAVPAGVYARHYLERQGLWSAYESRLVPTGNVRGALAAVENGSADAAIVYATDVHVARRAQVAVGIPPAHAPEIVYPAALVAAGRRRESAARFLAFLQSDVAQAIFARYGFLPPPGPTQRPTPGAGRGKARSGAQRDLTR
jgi:molybdate transport system substrate-binding protein